MDVIDVHNKLELGVDPAMSIYDIKGAAFESYKFYNKFVDEKTYEVGMLMELKELPGYTVYRQQDFYVYYKGENTGVTRRMDLVVDTPHGTFIVELKALNAVDEKQRRQLWSYMKLMNCHYGMLINFSPTGVYSETWCMNLYTYEFCKV